MFKSKTKLLQFTAIILMLTLLIVFNFYFKDSFEITSVIKKGTIYKIFEIQSPDKSFALMSSVLSSKKSHFITLAKNYDTVSNQASSFSPDYLPENDIYLTSYMKPLTPSYFKAIGSGSLNLELINFPKEDELEEVTIDSIEDGDTIILENGEQVRYIGIDTPEKWEYLGDAATDINTTLIPGSKVKLEYDDDLRDPYDRILAYVFVGNTFINGELVKNGYARVATYVPNVKYQRFFENLEKTAKANNLPMWQCYD